MKKIAFCLFALILATTFNPISLKAETTPVTNTAKTPLTPAEKAKVDAIMLRLQEIKDMDKTNLSASEKRSLKKEVRMLKHEAKATNGVYLSVGAIIIIILLLILIL